MRNLTHYAAKYEEEFARFLPPFTKVILELATRFTASPHPKHDAVVTQCLQVRFLHCTSLSLSLSLAHTPTSLNLPSPLLPSPPLQFTAKVIEKQRYGSLFGATDMKTDAGRASAVPALKMLVEQMVVPCLSLRESDLELLEDNPTEFLRSDMEGSDLDTRRRGASDLCRSAMRHFDSEISALCNAQVHMSHACSL